MRQGIKKTFNECTGKEVRTCVQLTDGFSNENYLINDAYVIRFILPHGDTTISRSNEKKVYETIAPLNISEKLTYFDSKTGLKITKYVHNPTKYKTTPTNNEILLVAKSLKKLHRSKLRVPFDYNATKKLKTYKKIISPELYINQEYEKHVIDEYKKHYLLEDVVLAHNDLVQGNLLFKFNGLTIIDWEYSAMNSFYFDLASFVSENNLNDEQKEFFLSKYFGYKYSNRKKKIVDVFINLQDILFYYWALYLYKKRGNPIYQEIAQIKLERINTTMNSLKN